MDLYIDTGIMIEDIDRIFSDVRSTIGLRGKWLMNLAQAMSEGVLTVTCDQDRIASDSVHVESALQLIGKVKHSGRSRWITEPLTN